jgi:hypothetical protein
MSMGIAASCVGCGFALKVFATRSHGEMRSYTELADKATTHEAYQKNKAKPALQNFKINIVHLGGHARVLLAGIHGRKMLVDARLKYSGMTTSKRLFSCFSEQY